MAENSTQAKFRHEPLPHARFSSNTSDMWKKGRPYQNPNIGVGPVVTGLKLLKKWRLHRGITQGRLGELAGFPTSSISAMERLRQGFDDKGLARLAAALNIPRTALLEVDPTDPESVDIVETWTSASPEQREQITKLVRVIVPARRGE